MSFVHQTTCRSRAENNRINFTPDNKTIFTYDMTTLRQKTKKNNGFRLSSPTMLNPRNTADLKTDNATTNHVLAESLASSRWFLILYRITYVIAAVCTGVFSVWALACSVAVTGSDTYLISTR